MTTLYAITRNNPNLSDSEIKLLQDAWHSYHFYSWRFRWACFIAACVRDEKIRALLPMDVWSYLFLNYATEPGYFFSILDSKRLNPSNNDVSISQEANRQKLTDPIVSRNHFHGRFLTFVKDAEIAKREAAGKGINGEEGMVFKKMRIE